jgi:hypothetical protein
MNGTGFLGWAHDLAKSGGAMLSREDGSWS